MFGKHWTPAQGTVVDRRTVKTTGDGLVSICEFVVDVRTPDGELFRAKIDTPRIAIDFKDPTVGMAVQVEYDPASHKVRFDKDDPTLSMKAHNKSRHSSFDAVLEQPAGSPIVGTQALDPRIAQVQALLRAVGAETEPPESGPVAPGEGTNDRLTRGDLAGAPVQGG